MLLGIKDDKIFTITPLDSADINCIQCMHYIFGTFYGDNDEY